MATMLAARYLGPHQIEPVETTVPEIQPGEALVQVSACGFCGSDLGIIAGVHPRAKAPLTVGHEFAGTVAALDRNVSGLRVGDLVTAFPLISCGNCFVCRTGNAHVCRNLRLYGFDVDGGMAEYIRVAAANLIKLPDDMPPRLGVLIEPLAVAVHGLSRVPVEEIRTAVVLGAGPIGILTALVARARGIEHVVISEVAEFRRQLAMSLGLYAVPAGPELHAHIKEKTFGEGADLILDCAAVPATAIEMTSLVRPRGIIVILGVFKKPVAVDMQAINFKELTMLGSRVYTRHDFLEAIALARDLPLEKIVTHSFTLSEVREAFNRFESGDNACKVLVFPNGSSEVNLVET